MTRRPPMEREARATMLGRNALQSATFSERRALANFREKIARENLYGGPQRFGDLLTPEMERRVRDSIRIVNLAHAGAGRAKQTETLALKVFDEVAMLNGRGVLTDEQKFAAEKLQRDFTSAGMDGVQAIDYAKDKVDNSARDDDRLVDSMAAIDRYVAAIRQIPRACWPIVREIVLAGARLDVIRLPGMNSRKLRRLKVITLLQVGLEQLVAFYGFDRKKFRRHVKLNGDARPKAADFASTAELSHQSEGA